jgi:hypothetical protein
MKKILFVDDNLRELENGQKELKSAGFECDTARGISDAEELLKADKYDCLIIDLNMDNTHLPDEYKGETDGGALTGWVWLYRVVKPLLSAGPSTKFLIYSAFIDELEERIKSSDCQHDERVFFNRAQIKCTTKANAVNGINVLTENVKCVLKGGN